jgi:hypothetical protein
MKTYYLWIGFLGMISSISIMVVYGQTNISENWSIGIEFVFNSFIGCWGISNFIQELLK